MSSLTRWQRSQAPAWPTFGRLFNLRNEVDRFFEGHFGDLRGSAPVLRVWNPAVDLYEDKDNVYVKAELPGMKKEDIDVSLQADVLSISGERKSGEKPEATEAYRVERFTGRFNRTITLPSEVKADQITAQYKDGILTVTLPKAEEAKPRQISINVNN